MAELNFNSPPRVEAMRQSDIDLFDQFDTLVARYYLSIMYAQLPTEAVQEQLVSGVQQGDAQAARTLITANKGFVATVVRQFKGTGTASSELLIEGSKALLETARAEEPGNDGNFADQAILAIESRLGSMTARSFDNQPEALPDRPSERIRQYAIDLFPIAPDQLTKNLELLSSFSPFERQVLSLLYLRKNRISRELECPAEDVQSVIDQAKAKIDPEPPTTTALALELCNRGVQYKIRRPIIPLVEFMSNDQLDLGGLLGLPYPDIAKIRGTTVERIESQVGHMRNNTGARTRVELALQFHVLDTGERRPIDDPPPIDEEVE